jgi:hypothetical protein
MKIHGTSGSSRSQRISVSSPNAIVEDSLGSDYIAEIAVHLGRDLITRVYLITDYRTERGSTSRLKQIP